MNLRSALRGRLKARSILSARYLEQGCLSGSMNPERSRRWGVFSPLHVVSFNDFAWIAVLPNLFEGMVVPDLFMTVFSRRVA